MKRTTLPKSRRLNGATAANTEAGHLSTARLKSMQRGLAGKGVKYCLGAYVDIHGVPKGKFVPIEHF